MKLKPILILTGEPNSIFFEIFFKSLKKKKFRSPIVLIGSLRLLKLNMKKFNFKKKIIVLNQDFYKKLKLNNKSINILNVNYDVSKNSKKFLIKSKSYVEKCFNEAFKLINIGLTDKLLNGPISKKNFLNKKFLGVTEYLAYKFNTKDFAMLIYNKELSVCPITTHLPLKSVVNNIDKRNLIKKIKLVNNFFKKNLKIEAKIGVAGLNPHCESINRYNEDDKIIRPIIKSLKKSNYNISGPHPADTLFLKNNRKKFNVIIGMYHDQVLTPIKTIFEYDAINITLGLPFKRVSPDHGPNEKMVGKNISNPLSLIRAIEFLDKN